MFIYGLRTRWSGVRISVCANSRYNGLVCDLSNYYETRKYPFEIIVKMLPMRLHVIGE